MFEQLISKIRNKTVRIGVIGLGYVGLPLATGLAKSEYQVVGVDVTKEKVDLLNAGESYIPDVATEEVADLVESVTDKQRTIEIDDCGISSTSFDLAPESEEYECLYNSGRIAVKQFFKI